MRDSELYNEYELVYMIQQGDEHSLQLLLRQYQPKISAIIRQNCTYQVMARHYEGDLYQIAAAALLRSVFEYREEKEASFSTFSASVIKNAIIDYERALYRKDFSLTHDVLHLDAAINKEGSRNLMDAVESPRVEEDGAFSIYRISMEMKESKLRRQISDQEYQIFCMKREGYSYREIAQRTHVTPKKVENTLRKVRRLLKGA